MTDSNNQAHGALTEADALRLWHANNEAHRRESAFEWFCAGLITGEREVLSRINPPRDPHFGGSSYEASMLRDLLARIHGDGGQYLAEHGLDKALEDAEEIVTNWKIASALPQQPRERSQGALTDGQIDDVYQSAMGQHLRPQDRAAVYKVVRAALAAAQQDGATKPPKHKFWGAGEPECPKDIKAGNGELHSLRCKVCGETNPPDEFCWNAAQKFVPASEVGSHADAMEALFEVDDYIARVNGDDRGGFPAVEVLRRYLAITPPAAQPAEPATKWSDPKLYDTRQRNWCLHYERMTGFEPMMCDYEAGNETFVEAAKSSERWYEGHTSDMYLQITRLSIPGSEYDSGESYV